MYISPSQYSRTFQEIKRTSLSHSTCKLVIFVACLDIDSLCSAKILSIIFKKELIQYQLIPVVGYTDLKGHFLKLDDDVSNVILIGCGSMLDLESFFELDPEQYVIEKPRDDFGESGAGLRRKIYVIDGHRPWNLDNLFGSSMVVCLDDGFVELNLDEERAAYSTLVNYDGDEEEEEEEEEDNEDDENDEDDDEDDEDGDFGGSRKRKREENEAKRLRKQRKNDISNCENTLETYYNQGTTIFTSTSAIIYSLLTLIGETSVENLWLAIIGTSSLDSQYPQVYDKIQPLFKDEVIRLNPEPNGSGGSSGSGGVTADTSSLSIDKDYHLFLLRHWTLYDSFFFSSHVNSKLNLWTEDGKKKLHKLFAKMGISLAIAQQKWLYVDIGIKKQLPLIFKKYLPLYGLEGIVREGFIRTFGYLGQLSAMECVESLTALLESDKTLLQDRTFHTNKSDSGTNNGGTNNTPGDSATSGGDEEINSLIEKKEKIWVNNFWSSWDALNLNSQTSSTKPLIKKPKGLELIQSGLEHAKEIQQIIFRTGMSLLERKLIKNLRLYRLCVLNDGSIPDLNMFKNPIILSKLGGWLLENIAEIEFLQKNNGNLKPLVVASLDVATDTYLVIGLAPRYPRGMNSAMLKQQKKETGEGEAMLTTRLNTFSVAFQQVASTSGAKVRIDSFDSSVIEIRKDDLSPFLEKLTLSGLV